MPQLVSWRLCMALARRGDSLVLAFYRRIVRRFGQAFGASCTAPCDPRAGANATPATLAPVTAGCGHNCRQKRAGCTHTSDNNAVRNGPAPLGRGSGETYHVYRKNDTVQKSVQCRFLFNNAVLSCQKFGAAGRCRGVRGRAAPDTVREDARKRRCAVPHSTMKPVFSS